MSGSSSASSRLGFKGMEDLGTGLSANFNLELGFNAGNGEVTTATSSNIANATGLNQGSATGVRTSTVGLASNALGSINIGRQLTGIHSIVAGNVWGGNNMVGDMTYSDFAPNAAAAAGGTASGAGVTAVANGGDASVNAVSGRVHSLATRASNSAAYTSPRLMGFQLRADYGNTTSTTANQPNDQFAIKGVTGSYVYGPITVNAGTTTVAGNALLISSAAFTKESTIINAGNIMYQDKGITVQYTIANNKTDTITATTNTQKSTVKAQKLSASYQMGAVMPFIQYGVGGTNGVTTGANLTTDDKAMQVGAEYGLSKRTNLYAAYGQQERKLVNSSAALEIKQYAVGLRHTF